MHKIAFALATIAFAAPVLARADEVHEALDAYAMYQNDVSALLDTTIDDTAAVDAALARLQRHNSARVARGWIAYGALAAAQSPAFAEGVERRIRSDGRAPVLAQLRGDVTYARREAAGAPSAVRIILTSAGADGARAEFAGSRYERYARYGPNTQLASGSREEIGGTTRITADMRERLRVTATSSRPQNADEFGGRQFWDSLAGREARGGGASGGREHSDYASVTDHMLTLGALVVANATESERGRVNALLNEPLTEACMDMQRLQLRQCLSVSVDGSERAYCLGRHALAGPGQCVSNVVR